MSNSLSLIVPIAQAANANALLQALDRGPGNFSRDFSSDGQEPATHKGCHTYDDELAGIIALRVIPEGTPISDYELSLEDAEAAINSIEMYQASADSSPSVNISTLAISLNLIMIEPTVEE